MSLLVATNVSLKSLCPVDIEGRYFESHEFGIFQAVGNGHLSSIAIKTAYEEKSFFVSTCDVFEALLMEVI